MSEHAKQVSGESGQKSSESANPSETAKDVKTIRSAADAQRIPVWAAGWRDGLPPDLMLQTKLIVNQPGDAYEQEADQVAEQVMRKTDLQTSVSEDQDQAKHSLLRVQKAEPGVNAATQSPDVPPIVHDTLNGDGGQPLDTTMRAFMEPRFGHDFSGVRVHTNEQAAESAQTIHARAYTVGRDVIFGEGQYVPGTNEGRRLLAHELTHVVQQRLGLVKGAYAGFQYPGSISLQRQPAAPSAQASQLQVPGLGRIRTEEVDDLIKAGDFQEAIDTLVSYKYMDYEIDLSLLEGQKMTFDAGLTSADGATSMPFWDYSSTPAKARPPKVRIGPSAFSSVSYLYSVIMHEYQHVLWQQTLAHQNLSHQAHGHGGMDTDEVEASAWELLHATETGLDRLPDKIADVWKTLNDEFWLLDPAAQVSSRPLVMRALGKAKGFVKGSQQSLVPFRAPSP